jgi:uncharacterized protein YeaO (DUF488 family)
MILLKRVYEPPEESDGERVLVERLWPRGLRREEASLSLWLKEIAPSPALRQWFRHDPERWPEFRRRYEEELKAPERQAALRDLADMAARGTVTLVFAARDKERNSAVVIADLLRSV